MILKGPKFKFISHISKNSPKIWIIISLFSLPLYYNNLKLNQWVINPKFPKITRIDENQWLKNSLPKAESKNKTMKTKLHHRSKNAGKKCRKSENTWMKHNFLCCKQIHRNCIYSSHLPRKCTHWIQQQQKRLNGKLRMTHWKKNYFCIHKEQTLRMFLSKINY